mgnify:CR=1 FL=1
MFRRKKRETEDSASKIDRYLVQANYYLNILEKRIRVFRRKLDRLEKVKVWAARRGQKELLIEALRSEKILKNKLRNYLGMHQSLQQVVSRIADVEVVKGLTDLLKEGGVILKELSREVSPEAAEAAKLEVEEALTDISEAESVLGEPMELEEVGEEEDLEKEAERLIAEASLPEVGEKEGVPDIEEIERELKDIMMEEEKEK